MKRIVTCLLSAMLCISVNASDKGVIQLLKPRLVVMTDIGDCDVEPDDMESAIRLMAYADMFEIEAIMTTVGWNCDPYDSSYTKGIPMNCSENAEYDELFPFHPLSETRRFIRSVLENN